MEERLGEADEASFEALFLSDETRARAPSLDLGDEDVVGLEQVEQTAQIIETPDDQEIVEDAQEDEEPAWVGRSEPTVSPAASGGRFVAVAPEPKPVRTRSEKMLLGFVVLNVVALFGLFLGREQFGIDPLPTAQTDLPPSPVDGPPLSDVPGVELDTDDATASPGQPVAPRPAPLGETVVPRSLSARAQDHVVSGDYEAATELLEQALRNPDGMSLMQRRAALSSLAYCAERLGRSDRGAYFRAAQASLEALSATPENAWSEAQALHRRGEYARARQRFARLLLRQDQITEHFQVPHSVGAAMVGLGASYQDEAARRVGDAPGGGK